TIDSPLERERLFGQRDHVRIYGPDFRDRLAEVGFEVELVPYPQELGPDVTARYGLKATRDRFTWVCTKPKGVE
ncbi:MAG TPA: SAM-dependent methyltransferase, partial [Chloroflexota bacterium]